MYFVLYGKGLNHWDRETVRNKREVVDPQLHGGRETTLSVKRKEVHFKGGTS